MQFQGSDARELHVATINLSSVLLCTECIHGKARQDLTHAEAFLNKIF